MEAFSDSFWKNKKKIDHLDLCCVESSLEQSVESGEGVSVGGGRVVCGLLWKLLLTPLGSKRNHRALHFTL